MFNEIAKKFPNIQFTWIGDGELRSELTSKNITITGWLERKDVLKELNNNDIFILTSLWEGLPISLLEAMYMKKTCIVNNVIGNRDVIENKQNGYLANKLEDYQMIIKESCMRKESDGIIKNAYNDIKQFYDTNKMVKSYIEIYNNKYKKGK